MNYSKLNLVLWTVIIVTLTTSIVHSIPPPAAEFYGNVTYKGAVVPVNTNITAYDANGTLCGQFIVGVSGYYGLLSCNGDDINSSSDEGALSGDNITFMINDTPAFIWGNYSWASADFLRANLRDNYPPVFSHMPDQTATAGVSFQYTPVATDPDSDLLYYYDNTTLFNISVLNATINFTAWTDDVGNYSVNLTVTDIFLSDSQVVDFEVVPGFCGDGLCSLIDETCFDCEVDCGVCSGSIGGEVGEGGGGDTGTSRDRISLEDITCPELWECSDWSECFQNGTQYRTCEEKNNCETKVKKPVTIKECIPPGTCYDGAQNQGEEGVDCGGPCLPCKIFVEEGAYARLPIEEIPRDVCGDGVCDANENCDCPKDCRDSNKFPWWILLILIIFPTIILIIANVILRYLQIKKKQEDKKYSHILRALYKIHLLFTLLTTLIFIYSYWFWWCWHNILIALIITIICLTFLLVIFFVLYLYITRYDEEKKREKLKQMLGTHLRQLRDLTSVEGKLIQRIEHRLVKRIYELFGKKDELLNIFPGIVDIYNLVRKLQAHRDTKQKLYAVEQKLILEISNLQVKEEYLAKVGENEILKEIDEELKLIVGYLARKHKIVGRMAKIKNRMEGKVSSKV